MSHQRFIFVTAFFTDSKLVALTLIALAVLTGWTHSLQEMRSGCCRSRTTRHAWVPAEKKPPAIPKGGPKPRKEMPGVFWDVRGILYWKLCPSGSTVNSEVYCNQLQKLSDAVRVTRPEIDKIYFLHDNARPHTSTLTRQKLQMLGWEVISHPPYSPDLAPTDYHLFRSLAHFLEGKRYDDRAALEIDLRHFFESKPPEFYRNGIHSLPNRWRTVIDKDGRYFDG
ncbi:hypothetical protein Q1695_002566 [Nippostrongylus brasiliensis]|nr:hypothetical protein Q1695_002566 [Nippostrongylus brasiliensis]